MSKKDWKDNYAEVEVWVWANYRHKLVLKIPENSTAQQEALRVLKSTSVSYWCDDDREDWDNSPDARSRYEVGQDLGIEETFGEGVTQEDVLELCINTDINDEVMV